MGMQENFQCSYIDIVPIDSLVPHEKNRNKHSDEQIDRLAKIIEYQGQRHPIIVSTLSGKIVAGHGRWAALKKLKWKTVAIDFQDFENEEQEYLFIQSDNAIALWAELDLAGINADLGSEGPFDIDLLGIKDFTIEPLDKLDPLTDQDEVPEIKHHITKRGDVWLLGNHRVMCGDSTMIDEVEKLMNGSKADLFHTDPPYNVNYSNADRPKASKVDLGKIKNDKMDSESFYSFLYECFLNGFNNCSENSTAYIWHASSEHINFTKALIDSGWGYNQQIIWKKPMLLGRGKYQWAHEPCLLGIKGSPWFTEDRTKTTVWDFGGYDKSKNIHPTQKPVFIPEEAILNSSKDNNLVLDLFLGSGSTLIACEKTNRNCYGMELDEHYCDVIINRWQNYTGKEAILESSGQKYNDLANNSPKTDNVKKRKKNGKAA